MKPDDIPQWAWDEADDTTYNIETDRHGSIEYTEARASIARLVMKARSQAFEECAKIAESKWMETASMKGEFLAYSAEMKKSGAVISKAIRQHSQKGRDND